MASFKRNKLKDGYSWRAAIFLKGVRDAQTFDTKAEAVAWADRREAEILDGLKGISRQSVRKALERFRDEEAPKRRGERWDTVRLKKFMRDLPFVDKMISDVRPADIAEWRDARLKQVKPSSVRREMNLLRTVFEVGRAEWGWLRFNPMNDVKKPAEPPARDRIISDDERDTIVAALDYTPGTLPTKAKHHVALGFLLSLETAMRAGEVFGLDWGRVDLDGRYVRLVETKNGHARDVPLSSRAVELLKAIPVREGPVFKVNKGVACTLFMEARKTAGLSGFTYHDSRASACTRLAQKLHIMDLARVTGHRDTACLMRYYRPKVSDIAARIG